MPDKGVLPLMHAFEKLSQTHQDLRFVVIGDYNEESKSDNGAYQREVREIAARLGDRCNLMGSIPPDKMHTWYPLADLVVIPSQFQEPFCMVAIEAMGAAKPVLVSTRGGMVEFVKENGTGYHLREPMTADSIAEDIETVLDNATRDEVARRGQQYVHTHYSWTGVTQRFEEVLHRWFD